MACAALIAFTIRASGVDTLFSIGLFDVSCFIIFSHEYWELFGFFKNINEFSFNFHVETPFFNEFSI